MANFGQTRVHLVNERRARLLPSEDEDLSAFITEAYKVRITRAAGILHALQAMQCQRLIKVEN
jgi:hypothetical protein